MKNTSCDKDALVFSQPNSSCLSLKMFLQILTYLQCGLSMTSWSIKTFFVLVDPHPFYSITKCYGSTKTKEGGDRQRRHWRSKLYIYFFTNLSPFHFKMYPNFLWLICLFSRRSIFALFFPAFKTWQAVLPYSLEM